jgi:hypothetical protein
LSRFRSSASLSEALFGASNDWDTAYAQWDAWKKRHQIPVTVGAFNWFHVNNGGPNASGYGIPGIRGTYYYYVLLDPQLRSTAATGPSVGVHVDFRFRDSADKIRPFFKDTHWFNEFYLWASTDLGEIKMGQVWKRFGLDWDYTWWGDVQYFDGFKLNPDYGISWERQWRLSGDWHLDSFVQYFVRQDGVSGALAGGNTESAPGAQARNTGVVRVVSTWTLPGVSSVALGLSALAGQLHGVTSRDSRDTQKAVAVDLTYTRGAFTLFGEALRSYGVVNPVRYTSNGPSSRINDVLVGAAYHYGPITFQVAWSAGLDEHPSGHQTLWVPGVIVALTRNVDMYAEYVRWDVTSSTGIHSTFEDGGQLVLNWHI